MAEPLRLPEVRPPCPSDDEGLNSLRGAIERARAAKEGVVGGSLACRSGGYCATSASGMARGCRRVEDRLTAAKRRSPEDFLVADPQRPCRAERLRAARPTQRQAIDDETSVPAEVFERMLDLGRRARLRSTHAIAFEEPSGRPYLRHTDAEALKAARNEASVVTTAARSIVGIPPRPASSCASELAEGHAALSRWPTFAAVEA
eukprot:CAMPEP_0178409672 /NCGR_PEP_ID=MMETSP0689_2-20121128/20581_1 /TAXON_ID=160604 /ORGANISM="Amphidinium massartii, Strain CS-259" /LENGTH=203 /DNA_ID=CAMNT_0020030817 /DNA_START=270 /DNA_END=881 /DNA_ORIENTATION=-